MDKLPEQGLGSRISLGKNGQLLLVSGAAVEDSGTYMCSAYNTGGSDSASYDVSILGQFMEFVGEIHNILKFTDEAN